MSDFAPQHPTSENERRDALLSLAPELAALEVATLPKYNLDATYAASAVFAALVRVAPYREELALLRPFDHHPINQLATYAKALTHANALVNAHSPSPQGTFDTDVVAARLSRDMLLFAARLLVTKNKLKQEKVDDFPSGNSLRSLISDLAALHELVSPFVGGVIEASELAQASSLVKAMTEGLMRRNAVDPALGPLLLQRQKVAALLLRGHAQLQRAMDFLRFDHGDSRTLVPTVYVPPGTRAASKTATPPAEVPAPTPEPAPEQAPAPALTLESKPHSAPARPGVPEEPPDRPFEHHRK